MKTLKSLLYVVVAAFTLASCADDLEYTPAAPESGYGVHFDADAAGVIEVELDSESFTVPVYRSKAGEAVTIMIANTQAEEGMFDIPNSVTFEADKTVAEMVITYDFADFEPDVEYGISLAINDDENITEYGPSEYVFDVVYPSPFKSLGMGWYTEDIITKWFNLSETTWPVEIFENELTPGIFRLSNLFLSYDCPMFEFEPGDLDEIEPLDHYIEINATDPENVVLVYTDDYVGVNFGYGTMFVCSLNDLGNPDYASMGGVYDAQKGTITFPAGNIAIGCEAITGSATSMYQTNASGKFRVLMPGFANVDPQITAVENKGTFIDKEGNYYAMFTATPNKEALTFKYMLVEGLTPDVEAVKAAIIEGTAEGIGKGEFVKAKPADFRALVPATGRYTVVVVPFNGDTAGDAQTAQAEVVIGGGEPLPEVEPATLEFYAIEVSDAYADYGFTPYNSVMFVGEGENIVGAQYLALSATISAIDAQLAAWSEEEGIEYTYDMMLQMYLEAGQAYDIPSDYIGDFADGGYLFAFGGANNPMPAGHTLSVILTVYNEALARVTAIAEAHVAEAPASTASINAVKIGNKTIVKSPARLSSLPFTVANF